MLRRLHASTIINWPEALKDYIRTKFNREYSPSIVVMDMGGT
jgi:hypothetical protein